ncbi:MAG: hypothetical protein KF744_07635 [Taibaiella sp.]|nr:hypothetical protein [Taibaiella sp.]
MTNVEIALKGVLQRIGFLSKDVGTSDEVDSNQVIYSRFRNNDADAVISYLEKELLGKPDLPLITPDLKKEIARNILEIYINAITHGNCSYVYSCGYINKRSSKAELHFTLVDIGETIKKNVNNYLQCEYTGGRTIQWATADFNTTKIGKTGGLGLKLIQQFLKNNEGKIQIVSAEGFWEYSKFATNVINLDGSFPGTIVNIIFNLNDTKRHYLDLMELPSVSEIF